MVAVCKWMGGWSYQDYRQCPVPMLTAIIESIHEEARRHDDQAQQQRRRR